jgi:hypothetical protein
LDLISLAKLFDWGSNISTAEAEVVLDESREGYMEKAAYSRQAKDNDYRRTTSKSMNIL